MTTTTPCPFCGVVPSVTCDHKSTCYLNLLLAHVLGGCPAPTNEDWERRVSVPTSQTQEQSKASK